MPTKKKNTVTVNLSMPPQYAEKLKAEAARTGLGISELTRRALDEYWERHAT